MILTALAAVAAFTTSQVAKTVVISTVAGTIFGYLAGKDDKKDSK